MRDLFSHTCKDLRETNKLLPPWLAESLWGIATYFDELNKVLLISVHGNKMVQAFPKLCDLAAKEEQDAQADQRDYELFMPEIRARAEFAKNEDARGHPTLHAHALVGAWSAIEAGIEDICVGFLLNEPAFLKREVFSNVKIRLADFELLDKEERVRFLLGEVERQSAIHRQGVDRFESLLEPFGFSGQVPDEIKKAVFACHHIRNVIVHRRSIADRKIVDACPWLNLRIGEPILVTADDFCKYHHYLWEYFEVVVMRLAVHFQKQRATSHQAVSPGAALDDNSEQVPSEKRHDIAL